MRLPRWKRQERHIAKERRGRVQPGSGCGQNHKGDVRTQIFLIEAKSTDRLAIQLKKAWLEKICNQAVRIQKEPLLHLDIAGFRCYVVPEHVFNAYFNEEQLASIQSAHRTATTCGDGRARQSALRPSFHFPYKKGK